MKTERKEITTLMTFSRNIFDASLLYLYISCSQVKYVVNEGFGGIFVWSLDLDDFSGVCGKQFPLMNKIKDTFVNLVG